MKCIDRFVSSFLVSGLEEKAFSDDKIDGNKLRYEAYLRKKACSHLLDEPSFPVDYKKDSRLGLPWHFHYAHGDIFIDYSKFYFMLESIRLDAAVDLISPMKQNVTLRLWSYAHAELFVNGVRSCVIETPCYKPIMHQDTICTLNEGRNSIYIALSNLGVRDTRTLFALEIRESEAPVSEDVPDEAYSNYVYAAAFLSGSKLLDHTITFPSSSPEGTMIGYDTSGVFSWNDAAGITTFTLEKGISNFKVKVGELLRRFEICEEVRPRYSCAKSNEENRNAYYERIATMESNSGGFSGFSLPSILARKAVGKERPDDEKLLLDVLSPINSCYDCSDFLVGALIRYIKNYSLSSEMNERVKNTLLNYRYWMTMDGSDAMCFWSENHAMQFFASAYLAGRMFKDEYFIRAHMKGSELEEYGKKHLLEWFKSVFDYGFEEFLSSCYMCVTFAALINLYDYADEEIKANAKDVLDKILSMLSLHTFHGSIIAPMGRIYRTVIYPYIEGGQQLLNLADYTVPISDEERWLICYATSSYKFPANLGSLMKNPVMKEYSTGNALLKIEKEDEYILTSVQSPRLDGFKRWENLTLNDGELDYDSYPVVKSLNERFHGTTFFEPGKFGYQQHMWVGALSPEAMVFVNHPGGTSDSSSMRPGYWYGNGILPAVRQEKGVIGAIYQIDDSYPIHFTHVYLPRSKFDEVIDDGNWIFMRKGNGLFALWSSLPLVPYDDELSNVELRCYGDLMAYMLYSGKGNLDTFVEKVKALSPNFDEKRLTLSDTSGFILSYFKAEDSTQFV